MLPGNAEPDPRGKRFAPGRVRQRFRISCGYFIRVSVRRPQRGKNQQMIISRADIATVDGSKICLRFDSLMPEKPMIHANCFRWDQFRAKHGSSFCLGIWRILYFPPRKVYLPQAPGADDPGKISRQVTFSTNVYQSTHGTIAG